MPLRELAEGSFIYADEQALDKAFCDKIIEQFEASSDQQYQGRIGQAEQLASDIKQSTDLRVSGRADWRETDERLQQSLQSVLSELCVIHPFFAANPLKDIGYNIQRTNQNEFYHWHVDGGPGEFANRQLVAIWYLNDVAVSGETQFYHQKVSVIPKQGQLILFPPFWTHLHRGALLEQGTKYIATTWICFA